MKRILIVGSGDVARRALPWLTTRFRVFAVVRREAEREPLRRLGAVPVLADLDQPASLHRLAGIADFVLHLHRRLQRGGAIPEPVICWPCCGAAGV